jgi:hypothetical protein
MQALRRLGIAFGSLVAAWLAVHLVAIVVLGPTLAGNVMISLLALVLGALVYRDIIRRERPTLP